MCVCVCAQTQVRTYNQDRGATAKADRWSVTSQIEHYALVLTGVFFCVESGCGRTPERSRNLPTIGPKKAREPTKKRDWDQLWTHIGQMWHQFWYQN